MNQDDQQTSGAGTADDRLQQRLIDLSTDVPDLRTVRSAVLSRAKNRTRRRRRAALSLAAASVVVVSAGAVAVTGFQSAQPFAPTVSSSIVSPTAVATPQHRSNPAPGARVSAVNGSAASLHPAENILLVGTDSRPGGAAAVGEADTVMLVHLSGDRRRVSVVSIPRDTIIPAPACKEWNSSTGAVSDKEHPVIAGSRFHFDNAYVVGGPACTVTAAQNLTGLHIDRFIGIDFTGFQAMVDALGGLIVNACAPVTDTVLGVILPRAGVQKVTGAQALNLVRARVVEGAVDLKGIRRQQAVLAAMLRQVDQTGTLLDPSKLDAFLQALGRNTFTRGVSLENLVGLAGSLGELKSEQITFYILPTMTSTTDSGALEVKQPQAEALMQFIGGSPTVAAPSSSAGDELPQSAGSTATRATTVPTGAKLDAVDSTCI